METHMKIILATLGVVFGNFLYAWFFTNDLGEAFERSYFQVVLTLIILVVL